MKMFALLTTLLLTLSTSVMAEDSTQRLLYNSTWETVLADTTAKTLYKRNPIHGKVGAIFAVSCVNDDGRNYRAVNFVIGDRYTIPRHMADVIGDMTFDPKTVNGDDSGLHLVFSNGSSHTLPFMKRSSNEVKLVTLSAMTTLISDETLADFKASEWVDVRVMYQGKSYKTLPAFSLSNSGPAIDNISNCYSI